MKIKKGDTVKIIAGGNSKRNQDKGKTGEVIGVNVKNETVLVSGVNIVVKHNKPTQKNPDGNIETKEAPIHVSNVAYYDTKAKKTVKIGYAVIDGKKVRVNKETGLPLEKKAAKKAAKVVKEKPVEEVAEKPAKKKAAPKKKAAAEVKE